MPESDTAPNSDPSPSSTPGAGDASPNLSVVPPPEPKRRSPSELNQAQQREIERVKAIVAAAQAPAHRAPLIARQITDAFLATLSADIAAVQNCVTRSVSCTNKKEGLTEDHSDAVETLVDDLRIAQAAARQKYFHSDPSKLNDYFVGERIDANRATLDQAAQTIVTKLTEDRPPGIDTSFINKVEADRAQVQAKATAQSAEGGAAKSERELRDAAVRSIKERGQQIQFAADAAWPAHVPGNGGIRKQFYLPFNRPFVG